MKINNIIIRDYGPLNNIELTDCSNFNLIYGLNEKGKTLIIDAIIKFLISKKKSKIFEKIKRVDDKPSGYLEIMVKNNQLVKIPGNYNLFDEYGIDDYDLENLFIIRDSDIEIQSDKIDKNENYFAYLTDKVTGLQRKTIDKLKKELQSIGNLTNNTSTAKIANSKECAHLSSRIEKAQNLILELENFQKELITENIFSIEEKIILLNDKLDITNKTLSEYELAELRELYEKSINYYNLINVKKSELNEYEKYNIKNKDEYQKYIFNLTRVKNELLDNEKKYNDINLITEQLKKEYDEIGLQKDSNIKLNNIIETKIEPEIKEYTDKVQKYTLQNHLSNNFLAIAIVGLLFFAFFTFSLIFYDLLPVSVSKTVILSFFSVTGFIFFLSLFLFLKFKFNIVKFEKYFEYIKSIASEYGFDGQTIEGIKSKIYKYKEDNQNIIEQFLKFKTKIELNKDELNKILSGRTRLTDKISEIESNIILLNNKYKINSLTEFDDMIDKKNHIQQEHNNLLMKLLHILELDTEFDNSDLDNINTDIIYNKILEYEVYKDKSTELKFDKNEYLKLSNERESYINKFDKLNEKLRNYYEKLNYYDKKCIDILYSEYEKMEFFTDIDVLLVKLKNMVYKANYNAANARYAISIFEKIELEEKTKIDELFNNTKSVSDYYKNITGGRYEKIIYQNNMIKVLTKKQQLLSIDTLSGGAYDQLYFSIRFALAEKILSGETGFFILDDPFIKSDVNRINSQFLLLQELVKKGWQIFYFSCKEEINNLIVNSSNNINSKIYNL